MEFQLPAEVEFGLTDGMEALASADTAASNAPDTTEPASAAGDGLGDDSAARDAGPTDSGLADSGLADSGLADSGLADTGLADSARDSGPEPDSGFRRDSSADPASNVVDAGTAEHAAADASAVDAASADSGPRDAGPADSGSSTSRIPPGAQLAIRLNMERIRSSPLATEVRRLLTAIPDWHALLDGSGIDPLEDLDRLLLASPNLQRERMVLAGRHARDPSFAAAATARLALSQHRTVEFHSEGPARVAPWHNQGATRRVIALLGDHHFIICRPVDLPRVLALMRMRAEDQPADGGPPSLSAADALLALGDEELMSFEVQGARRFLAAGDPARMPLSGRLTAVEQTREVRLSGVARFESVEQARAAQSFWSEQIRRLASNPMVSLVRLDQPLRQLTITPEGAALRFETHLGIAQARLVLGYVEGMLVQYRRDRERRLRSRGARNGATPGSSTAPSAAMTMSGAATSTPGRRDAATNAP